MKAKIDELNEILSRVRELEEKVKALDVLPNWEEGLKNDILRNLSVIDYAVSDFVISENEKMAEAKNRPKKTLRDVVEEVGPLIKAYGIADRVSWVDEEGNVQELD